MTFPTLSAAIAYLASIGITNQGQLAAIGKRLKEVK